MGNKEKQSRSIRLCTLKNSNAKCTSDEKSRDVVNFKEQKSKKAQPFSYHESTTLERLLLLSASVWLMVFLLEWRKHTNPFTILNCGGIDVVVVVVVVVVTTVINEASSTPPPPLKRSNHKLYIY